MYDYLCEACGLSFADIPFVPLGEPHPHAEECPQCGRILIRGVATVNTGEVMQEHFNVAVGKPISSNRQFKDELKRQSELMSARTGTDHRFVPVDTRDQAAVGATDEGLDASAKVRRDAGKTTSTRRFIT